MISTTFAIGLASGIYASTQINALSMRITHSSDRSNFNYFLEKSLKDVDNFKDLGITITRDLSRGNHIGIAVNKANKV